MKYLMKYEGYSSKERLDDILDKIKKYGMSSISSSEKDFLDSHSTGNELEVHNRLTKEESVRLFEDDNGYFSFEHNETEDYGDEIHYIGVMYVPNLKFANGDEINGELEGRLIVYDNGQISINFSKTDKDGDDYDIFEFCEGLEYELDDFIEYIIQELKEN